MYFNGKLLTVLAQFKTSVADIWTLLAAADPNAHAEYFEITESGVLSLKPEFRGEPAKTTYPNAISDMGAGAAGSRNAELPEHLVIPETVSKIAVSSIVDGAFYGNKVVKSVVLPDAVKAIPAYCFRDAFALENVYNAEGVTVVGKSAFQNTNIRYMNLPNMTTLGAAAFCQCSCLTHVNVGKITEILDDTFFKCCHLCSVESENLITYVGRTAFASAHKLTKADFVENLTSIGIGGFIGTGLDYSYWTALAEKGCAFGNNATPLQYNPTDFWSACTVTASENPIPTLMCQSDPRWNNRDIGTTGLKWGANGCQLFCIMHIYCGLNNLYLSSVKEFEDIVESISAGHLNTFTGNFDNVKPFCETLGLTVTEYGEFNQANLQTLYNALAAGKYAVVGVYSGSTKGYMYGHAAVVYGLTADGRLKVANSGYKYYTDRTKGGSTYAVAYNSLLAPTNENPEATNQDIWFCIVGKD